MIFLFDSPSAYSDAVGEHYSPPSPQFLLFVLSVGALLFIWFVIKSSLDRKNAEIHKNAQIESEIKKVALNPPSYSELKVSTKEFDDLIATNTIFFPESVFKPKIGEFLFAIVSDDLIAIKKYCRIDSIVEETRFEEIENIEFLESSISPIFNEYRYNQELIFISGNRLTVKFIPDYIFTYFLCYSQALKNLGY